MDKKPEALKTMEDFSRACGISRPTLSKYFQDAASVRSSTRDRIETALRKHDFNPSFYAVNMNRDKTRNIGILVPMLSDPFYAEMVRQFEDLCQKAGYWAVVMSSHGDAGIEARAIQTLLSLRVTGALVSPVGFKSDAEAMRRLAQSTPVVMFDSGIEGIAPLVASNNQQSTELMTDYLCRTGSAPIFMGIPPVNANAVGRRQGYLACMERNGQKPRVLETSEPTWQFEDIGFHLMSQMIAAGQARGSTIMCASDRLAFGAMSAAFRSGLKIGRESDCDIRIAGHDDHPLSRYMNPPLTTVVQNYDAIANTSFGLLRDAIGMNKTEALKHPTLIETSLQMRMSA